MLDSGALIALERGKARATRFLRLAEIGRARLLVPHPIVAEWWRGRTDAREALLASARVVAPIDVAKAAGIALGQTRRVDPTLTLDAIVMATAALLDAIVLTSDPHDFDRLGAQFPGVVVLAI